jgi:hypothetical protein
MQPKNPLFQKCLAYLEALPNVRATMEGEPYFSSEVLADGNFIIHTPHNAVDYVCEIKTGIMSDGVGQVAEYFANLGERLQPKQRPLLITRSLSNLVVDQLLARNIEFIDVDGNVYLNSPELYIVVRNQAAKDSTNGALGLNAATLQVMYVLLSLPTPDLKGESLNDLIAYASGVSLDTLKTILQELQALDYIWYDHDKYEIIDYGKLFECWELGYSETLRAKLLIGTFSPIGNRNFSEIKDQITKYTFTGDYLIGGELAASLITGHTRPISATLHLNHNTNYRQVAVKLKLKPDPDGDIVLIQNMGRDQYQCDALGKLEQILVHPLLIHAELAQTGNSRLKETAELIYDRFIGDRSIKALAQSEA